MIELLAALGIIITIGCYVGAAYFLYLIMKG